MHLHLHTVLDQLTMSLVRMSNALMESLLSSCQEVSPKRVKLRTYAAYLELTDVLNLTKQMLLTSLQVAWVLLEVTKMYMCGPVTGV